MIAVAMPPMKHKGPKPTPGKPLPTDPLTPEQSALVERYYPDLTKMLCHRTLYYLVVRYTDREDAIHEAAKGLIRAAQLFDPAIGNKFTSFLWWHLKSSLQRGLSHGCCQNLIRMPADPRGDEPYMGSWNQETVPGIDNDRGYDAVVVDPRTNGDREPDFDLKESTRQIFRHINPRHMDMVYQHVGLGLPLRTIAKKYGISKERVRQLVTLSMDRARERAKSL